MGQEILFGIINAAVMPMRAGDRKTLVTVILGALDLGSEEPKRTNSLVARLLKLRVDK